MLARDPLANPEALVRAVYGYVAYRIGEGPDAEDVTSETFERALRYRASYDAKKGEPIAWLIGIARRCLAELPRPISARQEWIDAHDPVDVEGDTVRRLALRAALASLGERDRELIALRYGADLTARQIGELLDARTNAIEVALSRARARLAELLEREEEAERPAGRPRTV